jgi:tetratricopeptide (TPR) repeat protein
MFSKIQIFASFLLFDLRLVRAYRCLRGIAFVGILVLYPLGGHGWGQGTFSTAGFDVGEQVELVRDELLMFKQTPFRKGLKGERFQVAAHDSARQRVFLVSKSDEGSLIAVNVPELAVRRLTRDWIGLNYQAFESLREGRLDDAKRSLFYLASVDPDRAVCSEIAGSLERLQKAKAEQKVLRRNLELIDIEVAKKLKNAASAEMPSALTKVGDTVRAERYRKDAERLVEAGKRATEDSSAFFKKELDLLDGIASKLEILKAYTESSNLRTFIETFTGSDLKDRFHSGRWNAAVIRAGVEASRRQVLLAQRALAERRLSDAAAAVAEGMKSEQGSYALRRLQSDIQTSMTSVLKSYGKALELQESKQFEPAVRELESSQLTCSDYEPTQKLLTELRRTISEKDALISKAKVNESLHEYEAALKVYETYALTQEKDRVLGLLATQREKEGNYVAAYDIFESLGRSEDMKRILGLRDTQEADYGRARLLLVDGKFEEALDIYRRFHDSLMEKDTWKKQGAWLEGQAKFDEAIALYRNAGLMEDLQRLKSFVNERESLIQQGIEQEKAGNFDRAIDLFKKASVPSDLKRVAKIAGEHYYRKKDYASAVEYFEIAGEFEEAGRIRREFNVEEAVRRLTDQELFKRCAPACVTVSTGQGTGSGFFIKKGGYILTNNHCVEGASKTRVITADEGVLKMRTRKT